MATARALGVARADSAGASSEAAAAERSRVELTPFDSPPRAHQSRATTLDTRTVVNLYSLVVTSTSQQSVSSGTVGWVRVRVRPFAGRKREHSTRPERERQRQRTRGPPRPAESLACRRLSDGCAPEAVSAAPQSQVACDTRLSSGRRSRARASSAAARSSRAALIELAGRTRGAY